ncbi:hypothetical protein FQA39_LY18762 [Lamprigera yunnana]|nr:hypothetical protein FQA39_LY18762 [Lamprigera yunnana]
MNNLPSTSTQADTHEQFDDVPCDLWELSELYCDSDEVLEEDFIANEGLEVEEDLFKQDYEIAEGDEPKTSLTDPFLITFETEFGNLLFANTDEENEVIMECKDKEFQALLIKNRIRAKQLKVLHSKLIKVWKASVERSKYNAASASIPILPPSQIKTDAWKLGAPYFKDDKLFRCPENSDCKRKKENGELLLNNFNKSRRWTTSDQVTLIDQVGQSYYDRLFCKLLSKVKILKKTSQNDELKKVEQEVEDMKRNPSKYKIPPYYSDDVIQWNVVANAFKSNRTPNECKVMWKVYLHPHINKNCWTPQENEKIVALAEKHGRQNWDLIAKELNTNRSGYLVFVNFFTNLCNDFKIERFTPNEDDHLLKMIESHHVGNFIPWRKISEFFHNRSKQQLYHRYKYYLFKTVVKGAFTESEDIFIKYYIENVENDFTKCATFVPSRSSIQIRNRYTVYLSKLTLHIGSYTELEDQKILDHVKNHGTKSWAVIGRELGRHHTQMRQRYLTLSKLLNQPGYCLENVPRRKLTQLSQEQKQRQQRLKEILEMLSYVKEEVTLSVVQKLIQEYKECEGNDPIRSIPNTHYSYSDKKILRLFAGCYKAPTECSTNTKKSAEYIMKLLDKLQADYNNLQIVDNNVNFNTREKEIMAFLKSKGESIITQLKAQHLKFLIEPSFYSILGLRGLIIKHQLNKQCISDSTVMKVSQNFLRCNDEIKMKILKEQSLFFQRFYSLFKWPAIISQSFPKQLTSVKLIQVIRAEQLKTESVDVYRPKTYQPIKRGRNLLNCDEDKNSHLSAVVPVSQSNKRNNDGAIDYQLSYLGYKKKCK